MSDNFVVLLDGMDVAEDFQGAEERIARMAVRASNKTAAKTRTASSREIRSEVNFPARYLISGKGGSLAMQKTATAASPHAVISGRFRPTSLARFQTGSGRDLRFRVKPGRTSAAPRGAFSFGGRRGGGFGSGRNALIAVRLKPGETATYGKRIASTQWTNKRGQRFDFLYGPSVNQVFRNVVDKQLDPAAEAFRDEFNRLLDLDGVF